MNMISGRFKNKDRSKKAIKPLSRSLAREMMKKALEFNVTYHPILDNFIEFDDVPGVQFDESLEFNFSSLLATSITAFY